MALSKVVRKMPLLLFLFVDVAIYESMSVEYLPSSWNQICNYAIDSASRSIVINCKLSGDDQVELVLKDLNNYTKNLTEDLKYSMNIDCSFAGNISMSWPMKIEKLMNLKVVRCDIYDYIQDWDNAELEGTADSLVNLEIIDSIMFMDMVFLLNSIDNVSNSSREWDCGHDETIKKIVNRNFSVDFIFSDFDLLQRMYDDYDKIFNFMEDIDRSDHGCSFDNLEEVEESYSLTSSKSYIKAMSIDTEYKQLKVMNFSHNGWDIIPGQLLSWYENFRLLEYMDLSYNHIQELKVPFSGRKREKSTVIDLRHNNFTELKIVDLKDWANHENMFVNIRGNPIDCDCLKQDFIFDIRAEDFFVGDLLQYKYIMNMTCASPDTANGVTLATVTKTQMGCPILPADMTIYVVVVGVVAVILLVMVVLVFYYRKEIKIIIFVKFNILLPWDVDDKKENKEYDAFVSYSSVDEDWIYDYLQPKLEKPSNEAKIAFKLCLHQRDFIGGTSILDNIIDSIENSRHTIVVLSRNFLTCVWALQEFKLAFEESVTKKHRYLIIIKYEDIPEEEMDLTMKRCLRTFTYLDVKDKMFVDRLRFALAIKSRKVDSGSMLSLQSQVPSSSGDSGCVVDVVDIELLDNDKSEREDTPEVVTV